MARPRQHDEATGAALLASAEKILGSAGLAGLSVRGLADDVGVSTRAIYSVFGSKAGLVGALGARAFDLLGAAVTALPMTDDAGADLVEAGVRGFRGLVLEHPALFELGVRQTQVTPAQSLEIHAGASRTWPVLETLVNRLERQGRLGTWSVHDAATAFHALCEGLAALELRCTWSLDAGEQHWRNALAALIRGFAVTAGTTAEQP